MNAELGNRAQALPLRVDGDLITANERRATVRAIAMMAKAAAVRGGDAMALLKSAYPDDRVAANILRAVSTPTSTASYPVANIFGMFRSIAPKSAALELFSFGRSIDLTGLNTVSIPHVGAPPTLPFVAEGAPGQVITTPTSGLVIGPTRKLLIMGSVTRELDQATPQGAVNIVSIILGDVVASSLDVVAFGTGAGSAIQPPGLLNGVTPLTPTAIGTSTALNAMVEDVGNLAQAIADNGIDTNEIVFVAGPKQAFALKMFAGDQFDHAVLASNAMKGNLAAFAAPAVVSAYADGPQVETSRESLLQYQDVPAAGGPLTAGPSLSAFQQELINIKLRGRAAWGVQPGGAQVVNGVTW